jgi:gas vesicle protein
LVWQRSTDRTHQSAPIATAKQAAASNQDISQDIEEAVVINKTKKQPSKETAKEEVKPKPKIRNQKHL